MRSRPLLLRLALLAALAAFPISAIAQTIPVQPPTAPILPSPTPAPVPGQPVIPQQPGTPPNPNLPPIVQPPGTYPDGGM